MIPKIIHYCWFGNKKKPQEVQNYIDNWARIMPDYQIMEWNQENFDVNDFIFTKQAYSEKKYAFVSDYVRLYALLRYGGIYLDTDVEIIKTFDSFLDHKVFFGLEGANHIGTAVIGSEKDNPFIKSFINQYVDKEFILSPGKYNDTPNTHILTGLLKNIGLLFNNKLQLLGEAIYVYPVDYFSARLFETGEYIRSRNTVCIHHFSSSWLPWHTRKRIQMSYILKAIKRRFSR
ncbi:glycosyltransferase family 32 protein [Pedobacter frigiditerrae]|uniref:glycosyltransferase family 32 protein n=1 Tax=Pedobacter frigiditerrae TaxID=2530452 RepID=UPI00292FFB0A|nr:glycosyltransferase [Pedobacter frigiditerrae]